MSYGGLKRKLDKLTNKVAVLRRDVDRLKRGTGVGAAWSAITGKPSTYPPSAHNQAMSTITGLGSALDDLAAQIAARPDPAATKTVPHQVTGVLAASAFPIVVASVPQGTARYPVKFAAPVARFRVHIRNFSYADATGYTGTVNLTGLWWGKGAYNIDSFLNGAYQATPTQINGAATLSGTTEWVSGWITVNANEGDEHLLSIGWTTPGSGAPVNIVSNWTQHWRTTSATDAGSTAPTLTAQAGPGAPFDIWLECDIPAAIPVVAFVGDSITIGDMYSQSFPHRYGQAHRVWPIVFGHFGGRLSDWGSGSTDRWTRYGAVSTDATVLMCGINDIGADATLNDLKTRFGVVAARIRTHLGPRVFVATVLPTNGDPTTGGRETIRANYNAWLAYPRSGINGTFDTARTVSATSSTLTTAYTWDGIHPSQLGAIQLAAAIPHLT